MVDNSEGNDAGEQSTDDALDRMLLQYTVPEASSHAIDNILTAARQRPQQRSLWGTVREMFAELGLPSPVYSCAMALVVGVVGGLYSYVLVDVGGAESAVAHLFYSDGWLL